MIELIKEKLGFRGYFFLTFTVERKVNNTISKKDYASYIGVKFYLFDMGAITKIIKKELPESEEITGVFISYYKRISKAEYEINLND